MGIILFLELRHYALQSKWIEEMMLLEGTGEVLNDFTVEEIEMLAE